MGRLFFKDKGRKTDSEKDTFTGVPNTYRDTYRKKDGRFHRRREFDENGYANKDFDAEDYPKGDKRRKRGDHVHDITKEEGRKEHRQPTKKEQRIINKAKRKRRAWDGD